MFKCHAAVVCTLSIFIFILFPQSSFSQTDIPNQRLLENNLGYKKVELVEQEQDHLRLRFVKHVVQLNTMTVGGDGVELFGPDIEVDFRLTHVDRDTKERQIVESVAFGTSDTKLKGRLGEPLKLHDKVRSIEVLDRWVSFGWAYLGFQISVQSEHVVDGVVATNKSVESRRTEWGYEWSPYVANDDAELDQLAEPYIFEQSMIDDQGRLIAEFAVTLSRVFEERSLELDESAGAFTDEELAWLRWVAADLSAAILPRLTLNLEQPGHDAALAMAVVDDLSATVAAQTLQTLGNRLIAHLEKRKNNQASDEPLVRLMAAIGQAGPAGLLPGARRCSNSKSQPAIL